MMDRCEIGRGGWMKDADFYLEHMPVAFCATEILSDENGHPVDYRIVYYNRAYAAITGYEYGTLYGKLGTEVRGKLDENLLLCCYDAAFRGGRHVLKDYSPDKETYYLLYIYPLGQGLCGCVLQDVTENRRMEQKLLYEHEKRKSFLRATTEIDFEYDFATDTLALGGGENVGEAARVIEGGLEGLLKNGIIKESDRGRIEKAFNELKAGKRAVEFNIQASLEGNETYRWYAVSSSAYVEQQTGEIRVVGYLRNVEHLIQAQAALRRAAMYDTLVDLYNVKTGKELVAEALEGLEEGEYGIMFLMDIDDFKKINDTYGHQRGDEYLKRFAAVLKHVFRKSDIVYRMGGDEFIGFAPNVTQPDLAVERIMNRLYQQLEEAKKDGLFMQISTGVFVGSREKTYAYFYEMADKALYAAKRSGKNKYQIIREKNDGQQ